MENKPKQSPIAVIFLTVFLDMLGFGILIPVIPQLLANAHSPYNVLPAGWTIASGFILLGFLSAIYPFMQFLSAPILGQLSDKYGRRPVLLASLIGTALSYLLFAYAIITKNLPLLFISRGFDGITGGNISVAQAVIADITEPQHRAKNFGLMGAAFGLGFIVGPYIGGKLSDPAVLPWFNAATPFWFAAILSFINVLLVFIRLPETHTHINKTLSMDWSKSASNIFKAFSMPNLRLLFSVNFLLQSGFSFFVTFFSVFLIERFNFTQGNIGDFFSYIGLWVAITQGVITRKVASRAEEYKIVRVAMFITGISVFLYFLPNEWWQLLFIVPIFAISNGLTFANLTALISQSADRTVQGEVLGINASVQALAQTIPPILSGFIAAKLSPETPITIAGFTILFAALLFATMYRKRAHIFSIKE